MDNNIYSTKALLGAYYDEDVTEPVSNYWLDLCFPSQINFETEYIDFNKIGGNRKIAPLVVPTVQGLPIYSRSEKRVQLTPAYVKPKDKVSASRVVKKVAGFGELNHNVQMTPTQRYNLLVADILNEHRRAIERRWEWLASEAIQNAQVVLEGEAYPRTVVDFERDAAHTMTLAGANRWDQAGVSIIDDVQSWRTTNRKAKFGGISNRLTVGADAWETMRQNDELMKLLNTDLKQQSNGLDLNLGMREGLEVERVGRLSGTVEVYVYSDYYEDADDTVVPFMDTRDVVLTGPNVNGVRCFGAIEDIEANMLPLPVFPKMWPEKDPSGTFIMTQSAPLMVPMNPNATSRHRVIS